MNYVSMDQLYHIRFHSSSIWLVIGRQLLHHLFAELMILLGIYLVSLRLIYLSS